jgi:hypothetical protein
VLQKADRWHKNAWDTHIERLQDITNQTHIMVQRQPVNIDGVGVVFIGDFEHLLVMEKVAMAYHHALWRRGRA